MNLNMNNTRIGLLVLANYVYLHLEICRVLHQGSFIRQVVMGSASRYLSERLNEFEHEQHTYWTIGPS